MASQPIRKDPSGSRSVERKFQHNLTALVLRYGVACKEFAGKHHGREMEAPAFRPPIRADDLIKSIQELAALTIMQPAEVVAEEAARLAYNQGRKWAEHALNTKGVINKSTGEVKPFYLPPDVKAIQKIKARNLMEIQGMSDELAKRMTRSFVEGFEKSETMDKLTRRVRDVTGFGRSSAERIARTETMRAVNSAAKDRFKKADIEKVEFLAAWDDRTCDECESLHGRIYDIGNAPDLPIHPNCRCTLAPVVE